MERSPPDRLRVLQFITRLGLGGAESVSLSLIRGLRERFEFGVFAIRGVENSAVGRAMAQELAALRVPVYSGPSVPLKLGGMAIAGVRAGMVSRRFGPGLVHLHTEIPESAYAVMSALRLARPAPLVRTIHNGFYWHFCPRLGCWCEQHMRRSHVACVSQDARAAFERHRKRSDVGLLPAPPVVIYNGVPEPAGPLVRSQRPDGKVRLLFAGRLEPQKGSDLLPEILQRVRPPAEGCELIVYGQGAHRRRLRSLAVRPPIGWTVGILPPTAQLAERMNEFDLFLMPSRFEGLGLVAIEAMLAGLVVIGTDAVGLREAIPPGYPWRAAPGDAASFAAALQSALDHRAAWTAAISMGRDFARQRFNMDQMLRAYDELYVTARSHAPAVAS